MFGKNLPGCYDCRGCNDDVRDWQIWVAGLKWQETRKAL